MSAKPGLTLIEIVLSLGLMALLFSFSMVPALYVYKELVVSEDRNATELLGSKLQDRSTRLFHPAVLRLESHGQALFAVGNVHIPFFEMSPCGPLILEYAYGVPEFDLAVDCDSHTMEIHTSGKIHIETATL